MKKTHDLRSKLWKTDYRNDKRIAQCGDSDWEICWESVPSNARL